MQHTFERQHEPGEAYPETSMSGGGPGGAVRGLEGGDRTGENRLRWIVVRSPQPSRET